MKCTKDHIQVILMVAALGAGVGIGLAVKQANPSQIVIQILAFPGELLMRLLYLMILPLISVSLIASLSQLNVHTSGRMGIWLLGFYIFVTLVASIISMTMVTLLSPGRHMGRQIAQEELLEDMDYQSPPKRSTLDTFFDLVRNFLPDNLVETAFQRAQTVHERNNLTCHTMDCFEKQLQLKHGMNILGVMFISILCGLAIAATQTNESIILRLIIEVDKVIMYLVDCIIWLFPIGVFSMILEQVLIIDDFGAVVQSLGIYMLTVTLALVIHAFCFLPLLHLIVTRTNPLKFMEHMLPAWFTAFITTSSATTLPVSMRCVEEKLNIDERISRFVLPVGANINVSGSAMYDAIAAMFIAQLNGISVSFGQMILLYIIVTITAIGSSSAPGGIATMLIALNASGLPTKDLPLVFSVDWILDRIRTANCVLCDAFGAAFVQKFMSLQLPRIRSRKRMNKTDTIARPEHQFLLIE